MPSLAELEQAMAGGVAFLKSQQAADGGFISFSSSSRQPFSPQLPRRTTFVPALMLAALAGVNSSGARLVRSRLAAFLRKQRGTSGAFNYWARNAPEQRSLPYPDDLDDTFCALIGLCVHDAALIDGAVLAQTVQLLLANETAVGGPYRTWLVPHDSAPIWLDVDLAVNANIAYFLSLVSHNLPSLEQLMDKAVLANKLSSPYYPTVYPLLYYLARAYQGTHKKRLLAKAVQAQKAAHIGALERALCLSARLRLGEKRSLDSVAQQLLAAQQADGSWAAGTFCADPDEQGRPLYHGAAVLTTAFVIEALQSYQAIQPIPKQLSAPERPGRTGPDFRHTVLIQARADCRPLAPELSATMQTLIKQWSHSAHAAEIIDLPMLVCQSLAAPQKPLAEDTLTRLGLASLYGWLAYTVFDDFLDEEGKPALLSAAVLGLRRSRHYFRMALPDHHIFQTLVDTTFDTIDGANAWEVAHCRFKHHGGTAIIENLPDYGTLDKLAERSFGHTLAPLAVLLAANVSSGGPHFRALRRTLGQYLIVRQLNDDLHDWESDLQNGRLTYVNTRLLTAMGVKPGRYQLPVLLSEAHEQFWQNGLPAICHEMQARLAAAQRAIQQVSELVPDNVIVDLLNKLDGSIAETLTQHRQAANFLKHYRRSPTKP